MSSHRRPGDRPGRFRAALGSERLEARDVPSFGAPQVFSTGTGNSGLVELGDLNGDSRLDVVATNFSSSNVLVFFNSGTGGFATTPDRTLNIGTNKASFAVVADVTGDTKLDVVAC